MSWEEMLEYRAEFFREVAKLRALPKGHFLKSGPAKKVTERDLRYLEAKARFAEYLPTPFDDDGSPPTRSPYDDDFDFGDSFRERVASQSGGR